MFQVTITSKVLVPVTILYACIGLLRHIYAQQLIASNFAKNQENFKQCLNVIILFPLLSVALWLRDVSKRIMSKPKWGEQSAVIKRALAPRSDGTADTLALL